MEEQLINLIQEPESQLSDSAFPLKEETYRTIGLAMEVHKILGKGFLEVLYKDAMELELKHNQIPYQREKSFRIQYKTWMLRRKYIADFIVFDNIILEIKAQSGIYGEDVKQTLNYLACAKLNVGLIINFGEASLTFKRVILN